jgi:hypothetical protein
LKEIKAHRGRHADKEGKEEKQEQGFDESE